MNAAGSRPLFLNAEKRFLSKYEAKGDILHVLSASNDAFVSEIQ